VSGEAFGIGRLFLAPHADERRNICVPLSTRHIILQIGEKSTADFGSCRWQILDFETFCLRLVRRLRLWYDFSGGKINAETHAEAHMEVRAMRYFNVAGPLATGRSTI
jgi:hypothetical protein